MSAKPRNSERGRAVLGFHRQYQICSRCLMDTSDPGISFDADDVCSHCRRFDGLRRSLGFQSEGEREAALEKLVDRISRSGRGREYDCLIGVSGGVDSTYVAYVVKEKLGLRPLAVHMDNGWNSTLAVTNIRNTLDRLGIDLLTEVLDWDEFRDFQLAFLRASTPDSEVPTDHAIGAVLMQSALDHGIKYVLSGSNLATEGIMPVAWVRGIKDWRYIKSVHARFGKSPLRSFPHFTLLDHVAFRTLHARREVSILNYVDYVKKDAMNVIEAELGWTYYGGKHYESVYTRFFQGYILPEKFGIDKRRAHLSTLIGSGEMTRPEAEKELEKPGYPENLRREDRAFVIKKLEISEEEFERIMDLPPQTFWDYPSYERGFAYQALRSVYRLPRRLRGGPA